jgi:hypothetical protein
MGAVTIMGYVCGMHGCIVVDAGIAPGRPADQHKEGEKVILA